MIRLMIADDHAVVREGLKQIFALEDDIQVTAEAANGLQTLELLKNIEFDMVLLDMSMPGINGLNLITRIRAQLPMLPILVLSMHSEPQFAKRALNAGVNGYVTKGGEMEVLLMGIRKVAAGGRFIEPGLALELFLPEDGARREQLSEREFQIMRLLIQGKGINEIADSLKISNKTVSTHKARLMQKMNFGSTTDMVRYAIEHGLVD